MTAWSEAEPFGRTTLVFTFKIKHYQKQVLYGLAWLLPTIDDEYRFSCLVRWGLQVVQWV
jgi:hypothetical protein